MNLLGLHQRHRQRLIPREGETPQRHLDAKICHSDRLQLKERLKRVCSRPFNFHSEVLRPDANK